MVNDERDICAICAIFNLHLTSAQTYRENIRKRLNRGVSPDLHSYRDSHGNEVDLVVRDAGKLFPVEIKSASTFTSDFIKGIERFRETAGERCGPGLLCYNGKEELFFKKTHVLNPYILHAGKIRFPALFSATRPHRESCAKTEDARNRSCRLRGDKTWPPHPTQAIHGGRESFRAGQLIKTFPDRVLDILNPDEKLPRFRHFRAGIGTLGAWRGPKRDWVSARQERRPSDKTMSFDVERRHRLPDTGRIGSNIV